MISRFCLAAARLFRPILLLFVVAAAFAATPARAGLSDCADAVVDYGNLSVYLAQQAGTLLDCTDKLSQSPPASAAITVVLAGLYAAGVFNSEDSCNAMIGSAIGEMLQKLLNEAPAVHNAFDQAFGKSAVDYLIKASATELVEILSTTPGLDRLFGIMTCGCAIIGTAIEVKDRVLDIAKEAKACASIVGDIKDFFEDVLESGVDALGNAFLGDGYNKTSDTTPCIKDDGTPWLGVYLVGSEKVMQACPSGFMFNVAGFGMSNQLKPVPYDQANSTGFCSFPNPNAVPGSLDAIAQCFCPDGATLVDFGNGKTQCQCPTGSVNKYGACIKCEGTAYNFADGALQYCGCPAGKAIGSDGSCMACGTAAEPGTYVNDKGYCEKVQCATKPGYTLASLGNSKDACVYEPTCTGDTVYKNGSCQICGANSEKVVNDKYPGGSYCRSCAINAKSTAGGTCQTFTCTGTDHLDPSRPHQCVACQKTTTIAGVKMCLDAFVSYSAGDERKENDQKDPCDTYVSFAGKNICISTTAAKPGRKPIPRPDERTTKPVTPKPGEAVQVKRNPSPADSKPRIQAPSLDGIGEGFSGGSSLPKTNSGAAGSPGGGIIAPGGANRNYSR
jgi:hypothetical protein